MNQPAPITLDVPIIVEFELVPGFEEVSRGSDDLAQRSAEALNNAMSAIYVMARRTWGVVTALPVSERPAAIEVDFNLKLTAQAGVILAKGGMESSINVKLKWTNEGARHESH
jgi:hypothetical protein